MPIFNKFSISNILIYISIIFTIIWYIYPSFIGEWAINNKYLLKWDYFHFILQFFTWTFIHWWIFHLLFNSVFIYYFWNILEIILKKAKYIIFFISFILFNWFILSYISLYSSTIWISWFALAVLTYYTLELKRLKNPEYKWWITAIIINLAIWLYPWVSLYWHLNWVIFWIIFFYLNNDFFKRQLIWLFKYPKIVKSNKWFAQNLNTKKD
jgi:membrane associated rhomboid family serine protease